MKKKKVDGTALTPATDGSGHERDVRLNRAIETVFRLTHSRDMTAKERRQFGLKYSNSDDKRNGTTKSSRMRSPQLESSELSE